jgi:hypothetical protein
MVEILLGEWCRNLMSFGPFLSISVVVSRVMLQYLVYNLLSLADGEFSIMPVFVTLIRIHLLEQCRKTKLVNQPLTFQLSALLSSSLRMKQA